MYHSRATKKTNLSSQELLWTTNLFANNFDIFIFHDWIWTYDLWLAKKYEVWIISSKYKLPL